MNRTIAATFLALLSCDLAAAELEARQDVRQFAHAMAERHGFGEQELVTLLGQARISDSILEAISRPAEKLPWHRYRKIFIQRDRIDGGVKYWRSNVGTLERMTDTYGVPPEIAVAIIGVETRYGSNTGKYRVLDSLVTLGFDYPKRGDFFRSELEQFLLLAREQRLDPLSLTGSYAGAMGIPQFISSSFRSYAVDFDGDSTVDIWNSNEDAIGSVGSYFSKHGWLHGGLVALPVPDVPRAAEGLSEELEPDLSVEDMTRLGVRLPLPVPDGEKGKLLQLEGEVAPEYWIGFWNFYVITRYNHSVHYAMAVYQLAQAIRDEYQAAVARR